jgi:hypothetical protein
LSEMLRSVTTACAPAMQGARAITAAKIIPLFAFIESSLVWNQLYSEREHCIPLAQASGIWVGLCLPV